MDLAKYQRYCLYLLLALMPTQLGRHFWPKDVLIAGMRVDYLSVIIYLPDLILVCLLLLLCLNRLTLKQPSAGKRVPLPELALASLIGWGIIQALWVIPSSSQIYATLKIGLVLIAVRQISRISYSRRVVGWIFTLQIWVLGILALLQWLKQGSLDGIWYWLGERHLTMATPGVALENHWGQLIFRPYATFSHPNTLAAYVLVVLIWIWTILAKDLRVSRVSIYSGSLIVLGTLILSYSQAAWLVFGVCLILFIFERWFRQQQAMFIGLALLLALSVPFLLQLLPFEWQSTEIAVRNSLFTSVVKLSIPGWMWGSGWYGLLTTLPTTINPQLGRVWIQPIHNSWWLVITSLGIIPCGLMVWLTRKSWGKVIVNNQYALVLSAILLLGAFDHYWITQPQTLLLFAFIVADSFNTKHATS